MTADQKHSPSLQATDAYASSAVLQFIHALRFEALPRSVVAQARRCLLDLSGVAAAGTRTRLSTLIRNHAADNFGSRTRSARILFDGRRVSLPGAALAGASTVDSVDAHDGHVLTKGHVGVAVLPVLVALADCGLIRDGREFLTAFVLGYEIATRAGVALHATACDYHTSGAWNALAAAALVARALKLDIHQTREALGTAEYFGPRSQMMRCIAYPTMVKDGSGWGAMTGTSAALLAADGFTGAPAVTVEDAAVTPFWQDIGTRWAIMEQYFKPYPVCRWAQPAVEAVLSITRQNSLEPADIRAIHVRSFHEACCLATRHPETTEQAQYSLPFPVAIAACRGQLGVTEIIGNALRDPEANRLAHDMQIIEDEGYNQRFPAERWADATVILQDGRTLTSEPHTARGDAAEPLSNDEVREKFATLTKPTLSEARSQLIYTSIEGLEADHDALSQLLGALLAPV